MVYEHYDFARNPIVEGHTFLLESKCLGCGFIVMAPSIEELLEEEKRHREGMRIDLSLSQSGSELIHMTFHAKPFAGSDPFWRGDRDALRMEEGNEVFVAITSLKLAASSAQ